MLFECIVLDHHHQTSRQLHGKRRNTDRQDIPYHMLFQLERPFMETDDTVFLDKMVHDKKSTEQHRDDRRNGSPLNPHIQPENENRIKYHIGYRPDQHGKHCFLRIAGSTHDSVEAKTEGGQERPRNHDIQIVLCIRDGLFASPESQ